jgi:DNA-binding NarL/FixJ family response regulator
MSAPASALIGAVVGRVVAGSGRSIPPTSPQGPNASSESATGEHELLVVDLTEREVRVVEELARGRRPKQIAFDWGVSLATVRTHIRHAKRKTAARTLPELAAMTAAPEWPASSTRDS